MSDGFDVASKFAYTKVETFSFSLHEVFFQPTVARTSSVLALPLQHEAVRTGQNADKTALWEWSGIENGNGNKNVFRMFKKNSA